MCGGGPKSKGGHSKRGNKSGKNYQITKQLWHNQGRKRIEIIVIYVEKLSFTGKRIRKWRGLHNLVRNKSE